MCAVVLAATVSLSGCGAPPFAGQVYIQGGISAEDRKNDVGSECVAVEYSGNGGYPSDVTVSILDSRGSVLAVATPTETNVGIIGEVRFPQRKVCMVPALFVKIPVQSNDIYKVQVTTSGQTLLADIVTFAKLVEGVHINW